MAELKDAIINLDLAEALGLAIKAEEDGYALYQKAIEITGNERAKEDLEFLRDQEKGHKVYFEKLLKETGKEYSPDPDSPLHAWFMENMAGPVQKALEQKTPETYRDALLLGLKLEDNSIRFYKELKKAVEARESKKAVAMIISEEKKHKRFLNAVLRYSVE